MNSVKKIIKKELLLEIGEANIQSYRYKKIDNEEDRIIYEFKTKHDFIYNVLFDRLVGPDKESLSWMYCIDRGPYMFLRNKGVERNDISKIWKCGFAITDRPEGNLPREENEEEINKLVEPTEKEEPITKERDTFSIENNDSNFVTNYTYDEESEVGSKQSFDKSLEGDRDRLTAQYPIHPYLTSMYTWSDPYETPTKGDIFKIMATITAIVKKEIENKKMKGIIFEPYENDPRRGRLFSAYFKAQTPRAQIYFYHKDENYYVIF